MRGEKGVSHGNAIEPRDNKDNAALLSRKTGKPSRLQRKEKNMDSYRCKVCGYIYDPAEGDPDGGIAPGTPFDQIPDNWLCPVCGAPKTEFEKV